METKNKRINRAIFHAGVHVAYKVLNSAILGKDGVNNIELAIHNGTPIGIYIASEGQGKTFEQTIPFSDILSIHYDGEIAITPTVSKSKSKEIA